MSLAGPPGEAHGPRSLAVSFGVRVLAGARLPPRRWSYLALAAVVAISTVLALRAFAIGNHQDWFNYAGAVERVLEGQSLYAPAQLNGTYNLPSTIRIGYSYPPPSVLLFLPFASYPVGLWAYTALSAAVFVSGLAAIVRREFGEVAPGPLALVLLVLVLLPGFTETLSAGNVNLFIAGVFAWMWALPVARGPIGAGVAAATLTKVFPGIYLGWGYRQAGLRHIAWAAGAVALVALLSVPSVGIQAWTDYVKAIANVEPSCGQAPSLACTLLPIVGLSAAKALSFAAAASLGLAALLVPSRLLGFSLLAAVSLAPVLEVWPHYQLFPYVALVAGFSQLAASRLGRAGDPDRRSYGGAVGEKS